MKSSNLLQSLLAAAKAHATAPGDFEHAAAHFNEMFPKDAESYKKTSMREKVEMVEQALPKVFSQYYPRKYAAAGGYTSPKIPAAALTATQVAAESCHAYFGSAHSDIDPVLNNMATMGQALREHWMPIYWVGRDLAQSALATEPPESLRPSDLSMPLDAILFLLPEKTLLTPTGADASWVTICKAETHNGHSALAIGTSSLEDDVSYTAHLKHDETLSAHETRPTGEFHPVGGKVAELNSEDTGFSRKMVRLAITLVMLMTARPALVETPTKAGPPPTTGKAARKLAAPNWIGRTYRSARSESAGGTHASPHVHWRRGHWRHQAHGPKLSLRKDLWIEPMIIGAITEAIAA
jgi:hypothetical protein